MFKLVLEKAEEPEIKLPTSAAAAAAKALQSCPTLCDPRDGSPPRLRHPGDSPGKNTGVGCHFLLQPTSVGSQKKQESSRKTSTSGFIDYAKAFDCVDHNPNGIHLLREEKKMNLRLIQ